MTAEGTWRHLGDPPAGATVAAATIDDGYLLLAARGPRSERHRLLVHAARPTARAMTWRPLATVAVLLVLVLALLRGSGQPVHTVLAVAAAALASLVVGALHDPAATLLATVPVSITHRRALRLTLVLLPVLTLWWALTRIAGPSSAQDGPGPLLALAAAGVAVAVWLPSQRGVLVGVGVPMVWYALDQLVPWNGVAADISGWWRTEPWSVTACAVLVLVAGRRR